MTIQQLADDHVGHPVSETPLTATMRESFECGALRVLEEIEDMLSVGRYYSDTSTYTLFLKLKIKELKGEL